MVYGKTFSSIETYDNVRYDVHKAESLQCLSRVFVYSQSEFQRVDQVDEDIFRAIGWIGTVNLELGQKEQEHG